MSTMSVIDLQCQEAMDAIENSIERMGFAEDDEVPALVAVEVTTMAAHMLTALDTWEVTLPHLLRWAYERFDIIPPTLH